MKKTILTLACALPLLAACTSNAEIQQIFAGQCAAQGYQQGSPQSEECIRQKEAALWATAAGATQQNAAQAPRQTVCTGYGQTLRCTTY